MAIATFDRDPARPAGVSDPRFKLQQEICRTGDARFWRAIDRRSGKACVVRVLDTTREETTRRLGDLHRERTLAERLAHPEVLRVDVPLIEGERIYQLVDPEPARVVEPATEGGRLAVLSLLVGIARVLADAHSRGVFHGNLTRASCLRTAAGRVLLQGFGGDAPGAAAVRDGIAADHRDFLRLALELLEPSGGPPPRLRRYFTRELAPGAQRAAPGALAALADELRESLEDTFPWPLAAQAGQTIAEPTPPSGAGAHTGAATPSPQAAVAMTAPAPAAAPRPTATAAPAAARALPFAAPPTVAVTPTVAVAPTVAVTPTVGADGLATSPAVAATPALESAAVAPPPERVPARHAGAAPAPSSAPQRTQAAPATDIWYPPNPPVAPATTANDEDDRGASARSRRPWWALLLLLVAVVAFWQFASKSRATRAPEGPRVGAPAVAVPQSPAGAPMGGSSTADRTPLAATTPATEPRLAAARAPAAPVAPRDVAPPAANAAAQRVPAATRARAAPAPTPARPTPVAPDPSATAAQAARSRVATLVAGGNRALNALEPEAAGEAFAAALALSPNDRAALEGSQRARRLSGVAALMRDAREATARGDHARAVQGYAQALSNDPRNRGLAEALAAARRNLARDPTGALLADGHAALGAGRLEAARDAFQRALAQDPRAPGARRGAEQAATAIALRDQASARRLAALESGS